MAYYLIDYENIKSIAGWGDLTARDTVIFFYSKNANTMTFDLHRELVACPAVKEYFTVECGGKNALDFQLSSYVGYLLSAHPDEPVCIVSGDKGFSQLVSFWEGRGVGRVVLRQSIGEPRAAAAKTLPPAPVAEDTIAAVLSKMAKGLSLTDEQCGEIEAIVNTYKTRQAINNNLMKRLRDSDKVGKITRAIKPFLKSKS